MDVWHFGDNYISTHTPLTRRDIGTFDLDTGVVISTHTPLTRRDVEYLGLPRSLNYFYSHASYEARHLLKFWTRPKLKFLLTRLLRGATIIMCRGAVIIFISTHTPLTRRD